ncbi:Spo11/DNA topoisomerase VI subunit A [Microdochium trichocladiopsis]|uniref:DNA topoisomerase (ATP-hydrolyzing) n=1 Tax=Microdochium trichocladiopsis TaxID=1682393 RepID=A0A9P9BSD0_9PEZI|nr:Spo11/DNA topoisomerase VI subunit A [Microdochium trichocladiopsis]KAH7033613.1 Spo11/DNA topoisomerase VI subunit A [Microdochium trichocladiopsis]
MDSEFDRNVMTSAMDLDTSVASQFPGHAMLSNPTRVEGPELGAVVAKIEDMLESLIDALTTGTVLALPLRSRDSGRQNMIRFPGANDNEVKKFTSLLLVLHICHEALVNDYIVTKRSIYYQDPALFGSQEFVNRLVDGLAFTLGVSRDALNIVAAAKGLIVGDLVVRSKDGTTTKYSYGEKGALLPRTRTIQQLELGAVLWVLVIEKEATFRSLAASRFHATTPAGRGILVTGKGYPDLATRQFLSLLRDVFPLVPMFAVVDYDPDGVGILSTYTRGSQSLQHEQDATVPDLIWLGPKSHDLLALTTSTAGGGSAHKLLVPTLADRRKAKHLLANLSRDDAHAEVLRHELQMMLFLNIKSEIQMVDEEGHLASWLDERLCNFLDMTDV